MIIGIVGEDRSGAREVMAGLVYLESRAREKIFYSGIDSDLGGPFSFVQPEIFDKDESFGDLLEDESLFNCVLVLDMAYFFTDSRNTQSKLNKLTVYLTLQSRRRNAVVIVRAWHLDHIDKRLRRAMDLIIECRVSTDPNFRSLKLRDRMTESDTGIVDLRNLRPLLKVVPDESDGWVEEHKLVKALREISYD